MALDLQSRRWFRHGAPYGAVLLAAVIFTPVLIWNAQHDWASFAYQSVGRVAAPQRFSMHELLGSILVILTPVGLVLAIHALAPRRSFEGNSRVRLFCQIFTLVPFAVFVIFSITHRVKLNWTGPLWLAVIPAIAAQLTAAPSVLRWRAWITTVALACVIYPAFLTYLAFGLPGLGYSARMELLPVGWSEMGVALEQLKNEIRERTQTPTVAVGMDRNFIASQAAFYAVDQEAQSATRPALTFSGETASCLNSGRRARVSRVRRCYWLVSDQRTSITRESGNAASAWAPSPSTASPAKANLSVPISLAWLPATR